MKRIEAPNQARFLTFSCYRGLHLLGSEALRDAFVEQLEQTRERHKFVLNAYVVMPNHVHLVLRPRRESPAMKVICRSLKQPFAQRVIRRWTELEAPVLPSITRPDGGRRFWQSGGGYDRNMYSEHELREKIEYIHMNPVRAGLVKKPEAWRWSSAGWWKDRREGVPAMDPLGL